MSTTAPPPAQAVDFADSVLHTAALAAVRKLARRRRRELAGTDAADLAPTPAEIRVAAALLADWWAAGQRRGIPPRDWHVIARESVMPSLALDAVVFIARLT